MLVKIRLDVYMAEAGSTFLLPLPQLLKPPGQGHSGGRETAVPLPGQGHTNCRVDRGTPTVGWSPSSRKLRRRLRTMWRRCGLPVQVGEAAVKPGDVKKETEALCGGKLHPMPFKSLRSSPAISENGETLTFLRQCFLSSNHVAKS